MFSRKCLTHHVQHGHLLIAHVLCDLLMSATTHAPVSAFGLRGDGVQSVFGGKTGLRDDIMSTAANAIARLAPLERRALFFNTAFSTPARVTSGFPFGHSPLPSTALDGTCATCDATCAPPAAPSGLAHILEHRLLQFFSSCPNGSVVRGMDDVARKRVDSATQDSGTSGGTSGGRGRGGRGGGSVAPDSAARASPQLTQQQLQQQDPRPEMGGGVPLASARLSDKKKHPATSSLSVRPHAHVHALSFAPLRCFEQLRAGPLAPAACSSQQAMGMTRDAARPARARETESSGEDEDEVVGLSAHASATTRANAATVAASASANANSVIVPINLDVREDLGALTLSCLTLHIVTRPRREQQRRWCDLISFLTSRVLSSSTNPSSTGLSLSHDVGGADSIVATPSPPPGTPPCPPCTGLSPSTTIAHVLEALVAFLRNGAKLEALPHSAPAPTPTARASRDPKDVSLDVSLDEEDEEDEEDEGGSSAAEWANGTSHAAEHGHDPTVPMDDGGRDASRDDPDDEPSLEPSLGECEPQAVSPSLACALALSICEALIACLAQPVGDSLGEHAIGGAFDQARCAGLARTTVGPLTHDDDGGDDDRDSDDNDNGGGDGGGGGGGGALGSLEMYAGLLELYRIHAMLHGDIARSVNTSVAQQLRRPGAALCGALASTATPNILLKGGGRVGGLGLSGAGENLTASTVASIEGAAPLIRYEESSNLLDIFIGRWRQRHGAEGRPARAPHLVCGSDADATDDTDDIFERRRAEAVAEAEEEDHLDDAPGPCGNNHDGATAATRPQSGRDGRGGRVASSEDANEMAGSTPPPTAPRVRVFGVWHALTHAAHSWRWHVAVVFGTNSKGAGGASLRGVSRTLAAATAARARARARAAVDVEGLLSAPAAARNGPSDAELARLFKLALELGEVSVRSV